MSFTASTSLICLLTFGAFAGMAQTLTCGFAFIGSGTIGAQAFTNAEIVLRTVGSTSTITGLGTGYATLTNDSASIWADGLGLYQLAAPTAIVVQDVPANFVPGNSISQVFYLTAFNQSLIGYNVAQTTTPWNLLSPYTNGTPTFHLPPANGWLANWNLNPILTTDGYTVNLNSTLGDTPIVFQAVVGIECAGTPNGNVTNVQAVINEALGVSPVDADINGDGVVNVVDLQLVTNAVLGCGMTTSGTIPASFSRGKL